MFNSRKILMKTKLIKLRETIRWEMRILFSFSFFKLGLKDAHENFKQETIKIN